MDSLLQDDDKLDLYAKAVKKNSCNQCRALGLAVCKGHAGGGGKGGSQGEGKESAPAQASSANEEAFSSDNLNELFAQSMLWMPVDEEGGGFKYKNPLAAFTIILDLDKGLLQFKGLQPLTAGQEALMKALYASIETEFTEFKQELEEQGVNIDQMLLTREGYNLTIKIPYPKYYDSFIRRLIEKNYLPLEISFDDVPKQTLANDNTAELTEAPGWKLPTPAPFNIVPKPTPE
ncbi:hypothetical protein ACFORL_00330 [Legionella dresdenensis]|uniref:Uncharacterized protein n=1 Tax=Legionella dresdenensis TaxID=450200 RepID=A0ABV8CC63_9GAMM